MVILVLTACARLVAGNDGVAAIWQRAARTPQQMLQRIGARFDAMTGRYLVPSELGEGRNLPRGQFPPQDRHRIPSASHFP
jgi:hypothetical protein